MSRNKLRSEFRFTSTFPERLRMDFTFTEDQEMTRRMVREFAENEIAPKARHYDDTQEFPFDIMRKLGDLGLLGVIFPPEYGGSGMSYLEYVCVIEELGRVDP